MTSKLDILKQAQAVVEQRGAAYGGAKDHFGRTVGLLNVMLADKLKVPLVPSDWPIVMICDKLAREANRHNDDNCVDIAGYAGCLAEVVATKPTAIVTVESVTFDGEPIATYGLQDGMPFIWQRHDVGQIVPSAGILEVVAYLEFMARAAEFYLAESRKGRAK